MKSLALNLAAKLEEHGWGLTVLVADMEKHLRSQTTSQNNPEALEAQQVICLGAVEDVDHIVRPVHKISAEKTAAMIQVSYGSDWVAINHDHLIRMSAGFSAEQTEDQTLALVCNIPLHSLRIVS